MQSVSLNLVALLACAGTLDAQEESKAKVYGVHNVELSSGVDPADFEKFVKEEFAKAWAEPRDGMQLLVLKGERGDHKGKYQLVYAFDSAEARDKHFPREGGGGSAAYVTAITPALDVTRELLSKIRSVGYTDYATLK